MYQLCVQFCFLFASFWWLCLFVCLFIWIFPRETKLPGGLSSSPPWVKQTHFCCVNALCSVRESIYFTLLLLSVFLLFTSENQSSWYNLCGRLGVNNHTSISVFRKWMMMAKMDIDYERCNYDKIKFEGNSCCGNYQQLSIYQSIYLSIYLSVYQSIYLSIYPSIYLSI